MALCARADLTTTEALLKSVRATIDAKIAAGRVCKAGTGKQGWLPRIVRLADRYDSCDCYGCC